MQYAQYDDRDTVAALQAVTIYFLLRLSEDNEATNFDIPLIYSMMVRKPLMLGIPLTAIENRNGGQQV